MTDAQGSLNGGLDPLARSPALRRRRGRVAVTVVLSAVATLTVISWSTSALKAGNRSAAAAASRLDDSLAPSKIVSHTPGPEHSAGQRSS